MRRISAAVLALGLLLTACETGGSPETLKTEGGMPPVVSPTPSAEDTPASNDTPAPASEGAPATRQAVVTRVVDGDTAVISIAGVSEKVRFIGINTPESTTKHEPYGEEASAYTKGRLAGKTVWLETDVELRDQYRRLLAYVWLAKPRSGSADEVRRTMFNARLLLDGYAQVATYPPNVRYVDVFTPLQAEARRAGRGLWGKPGPAPPQAQGGSRCDPSYPTVCIPSPPPDLDCSDVTYRRFKVVGADPHRFDGDRDGVGCES